MQFEYKTDNFGAILVVFLQDENFKGCLSVLTKTFVNLAALDKFMAFPADRPILWMFSNVYSIFCQFEDFDMVEAQHDQLS